jgi:hypothetical protein
VIALAQARQDTLARVGRGGLGEEASFRASEAQRIEGGERRGEGTGVARTEVIHKPSEAEQILGLLLSHLRNLRILPKLGMYPAESLQ